MVFSEKEGSGQNRIEVGIVSQRASQPVEMYAIDQDGKVIVDADVPNGHL